MYLEKPVSQWPTLKVTWSNDPNEWCWAFDGDIPDWAVPPQNLRLGSALISEIHNHLIFVRKIHTIEELREGAVDDKVEEVIDHWKEGFALTPPALRIVEVNGVKLLDIAGGNHRFNVANLCGVTMIDFLASSADTQDLNTLIPSIKWKT